MRLGTGMACVAGKLITGVFFALVCCTGSSLGSYVITVPKKWFPGGAVQVCIQVKNPLAPPGDVIVRIQTAEFTGNIQLLQGSIQVPQGNQHFCTDIPHLHTPQDSLLQRQGTDTVSIVGELDGIVVNHTRNIDRQIIYKKTIVQTDKSLYKSGQTVHFRVLAHSGPLMEISTENYQEISVTTPSQNRIAQWLNVDNSKGLVHLSLQLSSEPEEGEYQITIVNGRSADTITNFEVKEYILPRFEVIVKPPKYILATTRSFTFTACAKYSFGEPVKGNISWEVSNLKKYGCKTVISKNDTISGCNDLTVESTDIQMTDCNVNIIKAEATVTEDGTGAVETGKGEARVERTAVHFEPLFQDNFMKPNLPSTLKVVAKSPDGSPAGGEPIEICHGGSCMNITTTSKGIAKVYLTNLNSQKVVMKRVMTRAFLEEDTFVHFGKRFHSPSNSSLLIHGPEDIISCTSGEETNFTLMVSFAAVRQKSAVVNVQVISRGKIQYFKSQEFELTPSELPFEEELFLEPLSTAPADTVTGILNIPISLPLTASPKIKVLVWYIRDDGEVVSDVKEMIQRKCLPNKVDIAWSADRTQPGFTSSLTIASAPDSICSYGVVSTSRDTETVEKFFFDDYRYYIKPWIHPQARDEEHCRRLLQAGSKEKGKFNYATDYVDTLHMFDQSGLYIFTDLTLETRPCVKLENGDLYERMERFSPLESGDDSTMDAHETWLWNLVVIPSTGILKQDVEVPNTITEWVGKAVCVHPQKGVGLSEGASLTTYTSFFVDLALPPSTTRGKVLPVKISVFNYLQQPLPVMVTLESSTEYELVGENDASGWPAAQRVSCVGSQDKHVHTLAIRPIITGDMNVTVRAFVDTENSIPCGDKPLNIDKKYELVSPITVKWEGLPREQTWSKYLCAKGDAGGQGSLETAELIVPPGTVKGSERAWVTVVGEKLTLLFPHLGLLVHLADGSGEDNMINFAINTIVLKYLQATRQDIPEAKESMLNLVRTGYKRQLLYKRWDGSYSAYGNADDSGSSWFTAFVIKYFAQAREFILIDEGSFKETTSWLINNYGNESCAEFIGQVFSTKLKRSFGTGESSRVPLTAYILISLLESGVSTSDPTMQKALRCLSEDSSGDSYTVALKAYILALSGSPEAPGVLQQLLQQATVTNLSMHWDLHGGMPGLIPSTRVLEVETAGYAILAMMTTDPPAYEQEARNVVRWLTIQNDIYDTEFIQDTNVALQALATYESTQYQGDLNVSAIVEAHNFYHSFPVTESNQLVLHQLPLPAIPTNVSFRMVGQGCAIIETVLQYNDPEPEASNV
ncbi:alpha-1-inhibitor 3-like [Macrobrachium rosenbergii]|uniref:alpha-1-inhibitor 3-like n=1 Tax=Macrobrachium rosenbergii TaxID=79674 RepID=UPI0034D6695C